MKNDIQPSKPDKTGAAANAVLVADDDPLYRHLLCSWLEKWSYRVVQARDGDVAWELLQQEDAPQMVILDWMMPGIDGPELCRKLRNRTNGPYPYLVLITSKGQKHDVVAGLEAGADDYLTKPFDVDELHARIRAGKRILELQAALMRSREILQYQAAHDGLTGLWNRGAILELLQRETNRHCRIGVPLGVIMADLDHFKQINDAHGHLVGDAVLQQIATRMVAAVRSYDSVGRYGGEEFLIVAPGCDTADLLASAERLRRCVADPPIVSDAGNLSVTLGLGVASAQPNTEGYDFEELLYAADNALYQAKANGRNRVECVPAVQAAEHGRS